MAQWKTERNREHSMTKFTVIVENVIPKLGHKGIMSPVPPFPTEYVIIDADNLIDAWRVARDRWYIGQPETTLQIADIREGELEPPPPPQQVNGKDTEHGEETK